MTGLVAVHKRAAGALHEARRLAAQRGRVEIRIDAAGDGPPATVAMCPESLESAVTHLLDNALEASPPQVPVVLRLGRERGCPVLDIVDRGYIIYDGKVLFTGSREELVRDENVRRLYLGESFTL